MTAPKRFVESKAHLTKIMTDYFLGNHKRAAEGIPVVWIAVNAPIEILKGFDLVVIAPENHSAVCAARGIGGALSEEAEGMGFSMDLCSYARIDIGSFFGTADSGGMGLPRPSLLVSDNNNCTLLVKWFDVYRRELGVPHFVMDVPFCYGPQQAKDVDYMVRQFSDLIDLISRLTGQRFDIEKTRQALAFTDEANRQWKRFYDLARTRPSAITAFDTFVHMAPYVVYRGTRTLVDHFTMLADEAERQLADGIYPVPDEKYRLLWDNIAPWHQLRAMSTRLKDLSANIVVCHLYLLHRVGRGADRRDRAYRPRSPQERRADAELHDLFLRAGPPVPGDGAADRALSGSTGSSFRPTAAARSTRSCRWT